MLYVVVVVVVVVAVNVALSLYVTPTGPPQSPDMEVEGESVLTRNGKRVEDQRL